MRVLAKVREDIGNFANLLWMVNIFMYITAVCFHTLAPEIVLFFKAQVSGWYFLVQLQHYGCYACLNLSIFCWYAHVIVFEDRGMWGCGQHFYVYNKILQMSKAVRISWDRFMTCRYVWCVGTIFLCKQQKMFCMSPPVIVLVFLRQR